MNNIDNKISAELNVEVLTQIKDLLKQITDLMPFLIGLSPDERMRYPKMDVSNKDFVNDAVNAISNDGAILPAYINPDEMKKDLNLFNQLEEVLMPLSYLYDQVRDTQMMAGSEAYSTALMIYKMAKVAAKAGLPGANGIYTQLRGRFTQNKNTDTISEN
nr:hypothetical protein [uncultured Carboxylicivirga sp.]